MTGASAGYLSAPPVVGVVAEGFGLAAALGLVTIAELTVALTATLRRWLTTRLAAV